MNVLDDAGVVPLDSLVYVSTATRALSRADLEGLLQRARTRNLREGITGVLLYAHGNFMQYLEGPAGGLARVYEIIKADSMHRGIIELRRAPVRVREFAGWSMAFRSLCAFGESDPVELDAIFAPESEGWHRSASAAHVLLSGFWNKGVGPGSMKTVPSQVPAAQVAGRAMAEVTLP